MVEVLVIHKTLHEAEEIAQHIYSCYEDCHVTVCVDVSKKEIMDAIESRNKKIDVCFTKIRMRGCSGMQVVQELRKENSKVKIVFLSDTDEYAMDAWGLGVNDYLLEPITIEKIKKSIENM